MHVLLFGLIYSCLMNAQDVQVIEVKADSIVSVTGDLSTGQILEDLSWAWDSSNACFPATQKQKFTGNHVFFTADLPSYSEMEVTVIPDDPEANFSLYAYEVGVVGDLPLVPELPGCVRCEADHKWDYKKRGKVQDHSRTVSHLVAIRNPYRVVIGVVGAEGLQEGTFTLQVHLKTR